MKEGCVRTAVKGCVCVKGTETRAWHPGYTKIIFIQLAVWASSPEGSPESFLREGHFSPLGTLSLSHRLGGKKNPVAPGRKKEEQSGAQSVWPWDEDQLQGPESIQPWPLNLEHCSSSSSIEEKGELYHRGKPF